MLPIPLVYLISIAVLYITTIPFDSSLCILLLVLSFPHFLFVPFPFSPRFCVLFSVPFNIFFPSQWIFSCDSLIHLFISLSFSCFQFLLFPSFCSFLCTFYQVPSYFFVSFFLLFLFLRFFSSSSSSYFRISLFYYFAVSFTFHCQFFFSSLCVIFKVPLLLFIIFSFSFYNILFPTLYMFLIIFFSPNSGFSSHFFFLRSYPTSTSLSSISLFSFFNVLLLIFYTAWLLCYFLKFFFIHSFISFTASLSSSSSLPFCIVFSVLPFYYIILPFFSLLFFFAILPFHCFI